MLDVLDAGIVAHVGVSTPEGPIVLPMAYGRDDEHVFLHGAVANALLAHAADADVCVTVTIVDGLVMARTPFHNSMNYRSVVVRGRAEVLAGPEKVAALRIIVDHVVANWDTSRPPTELEIRKTAVLRVPLTEMSGKVRTGGPVDEPDDLAGPHWAGTVPLAAAWAAPAPSPDLPGPIAVPPAIAALEGRPAHDTR